MCCICVFVCLCICISCEHPDFVHLFLWFKPGDKLCCKLFPTISVPFTKPEQLNIILPTINNVLLQNLNNKIYISAKCHNCSTIQTAYFETFCCSCKKLRTTLTRSEETLSRDFSQTDRHMSDFVKKLFFSLFQSTKSIWHYTTDMNALMFSFGHANLAFKSTGTTMS